MAVVSNKGVPHKPFEQTRYCDTCNNRLVRKWKDKHIALCNLEEVNEAISFIEHNKWDERLDPHCRSELVDLRSKLQGITEKYVPEAVLFTIQADCILYVFRGIRSFVAKAELPEGSTKLFIEWKSGHNYSTDLRTESIQWFTDKNADHFTRGPWRVVGSVEL